jgi:flavin-binding protein dodecin
MTGPFEEQAETVLPDLASVEVEEIRVGIDGGRVGEWRVKLRGAAPRTD